MAVIGAPERTLFDRFERPRREGRRAGDRRPAGRNAIRQVIEAQPASISRASYALKETSYGSLEGMSRSLLNAGERRLG